MGRLWCGWQRLPLTRLALLGLLALLCLPGTLQAQQAAEVPDLATYEGWLREARIAAQRRDRLGLEAVAERLTSIRGVRPVDAAADDGALLPVDNRWLAAALAVPDPDLEQIAERLGAVLDALVLPEDAAPADGLARLEDILSRPPFAAEESESRDVSDNPIVRFLDWLVDLIDRLFSPVTSTSSGNPAIGSLLGWVLIGICCLLVVGVLAYLLRSARSTLAHEAQAPSDDDPEAGLTATGALQQASNLARGGDYRTAVRYLYLSALLWLDERGMLRYNRALTNREYLASLADNPELQRRLLPIIETFDRVWYGYATLDATSFRAYQQQVEELRRQAR